MLLARLPIPADPSRQWSAYKRAWFALVAMRVVADLAVARVLLRRIVGHDVVRLNAAAERLAVDNAPSPGNAEALLAHVSRIVPRAAGLVPWRSDCLVQAIAGQRLLSAFTIPGLIRIGSRKDFNGMLEPHAWLECLGRVVTGGDVQGYVVLLGED